MINLRSDYTISTVKVKQKHPGLVTNSDSLSDIEEVDVDGYQWAVASDLPMTKSSEDSEGKDESMDSPTSSIHMESIPLPLPLTELEISPITMTPSTDRDDIPTTETSTNSKNSKV